MVGKLPVVVWWSGNGKNEFKARGDGWAAWAAHTGGDSYAYAVYRGNIDASAEGEPYRRGAATSLPEAKRAAEWAVDELVSSRPA